MTKEQELESYQRALVDWEASRISKYLSSTETTAGLCFYFSRKYINLKELPVINNLIICNLKPNSNYIANRGVEEPRIALLKQAIEIITKQIEDENAN